MKRVTEPRHRLLSKVLWTALPCASAIAVSPAQAQTSQSVQVYGYVAPRCWVSNASVQPDVHGSGLAPHAICNQSTPRTESHLRALNGDGTLVTQRIPANFVAQAGLPQQSARTAMEIVISPRV